MPTRTRRLKMKRCILRSLMTSSKARGLIRFLFGITEDKHLMKRCILRSLMTSSKARGLIRFLFGITEDKHLNTQQIRQHKLIIHNERVANPKNENMLFFLKLFPLQARYVT